MIKKQKHQRPPETPPLNNAEDRAVRCSFIQLSPRLSDVSGMDFRLAAPAFVAVVIWYLPPALSQPSAADVVVKFLCFPPPNERKRLPFLVTFRIHC